MASFYEEIQEHTKEDAEGNITVDTVRKMKNVKKSDEPDYIKIYTNMWSEFNQIPKKWTALFFALARRMSYADLSTGDNPDEKENYGGQLVFTGGLTAEAIRKECGWKTTDPLYRGLQALQECGAIRKVGTGRGMYQVNPQYAGRGGWYYSSRDEQGGISNLIATFNFRDKTVETHIVWSTDNQRKTEEEAMERMKAQIKKAYATEIVATHTKISVNPDPGELDEFDNT